MPHLRNFSRVISLAMVVASHLANGSEQTAEQGVLIQLGSAMHFYEIQFDGRPATNWTELRKVSDVDNLNQLLLNRPGCPLEKHYVFVPGQLAMPSFYGETWVKLIAAAPQKRSGFRGWGRFVVYGNTNFYTPIWLHENEVQEMLAKAERKLSEPEADAVCVAEKALKKYQEEQEQSRRSGDREAWRLRMILLWQAVKGWFVTQGSTNPAGGTTASGRLRPVPVALAALAAVGDGILAYRVIQRRGRS